jgi:hypothetical protein
LYSDTLQMPPPKTKLKRSLPRYSIATLFVLTAIVCFTLSRFYPRVFVFSRVHVGAKNATAGNTLAILARSPMVIVGAAKQHPEIASLAEGDPVRWLCSHVQATVVDNNTIEIGISGSPKDRQRLQAVVDAIAEQFIEVLDPVRGGSQGDRDTATRNQE